MVVIWSCFNIFHNWIIIKFHFLEVHIEFCFLIVINISFISYFFLIKVNLFLNKPKNLVRKSPISVGYCLFVYFQVCYFVIY